MMRLLGVVLMLIAIWGGSYALKVFEINSYFPGLPTLATILGVSFGVFMVGFFTLIDARFPWE